MTGLGMFLNRHRVTARSLADGRGNTATWTYTYGTPKLNGLGTLGGSGWTGNSANPTSAVLYYNTYLAYPYRNNNYALMAHGGHREFRGHSYTIETDPSGTQTKHSFYQGDAACGYPTYPNSSTPYDGAALMDQACFKQLRDAELLKGREYLTEVRGSDGTLYQVTNQSWAVAFLGYGEGTAWQSGLWRGFRYAYENIDSMYVSGQARTKTTRTIYNSNCDLLGDQTQTYGNPICVDEYDHSGTRVRRTRSFYAVRNDTADYMVDRVVQQSVLDSSGNLRSLKEQFYDSQPYATLGTQGRLTLERAYRNVPLATTTSPGAPATGAAANYDDTSAAITYTGTWTASGTFPARAGYDTLKLTSQNGAKASLTFSGSRISYVYTMGLNRGQAIVRIDGQQVATVNANTSSLTANYHPNNYRRGIIRTWNVPDGLHTIEIEASLTAGQYLDLDMFTVNIEYRAVGTYDDRDALVRYASYTTPPDQNYSVWPIINTAATGAYATTVTATDRQDDFARFTFYGTSLQYIFTRAPSRGYALVTIDGVAQPSIDLYAASELRQQSQTYPLAAGFHTVHIQLQQVDSVTRKLLDVDAFVVGGAAPAANGPTLYSQDTSYGYDSYGNRTTVTTYTGEGTRVNNGVTVTYTGPTGTGRTTTTDYDSLFHAYSTHITSPIGQESADYDYRLGTLIKVIGLNGNQADTTDCTNANVTIPGTSDLTCAQYDPFGRMVKLIKPGDSGAYPTVKAFYRDTEQPFRYEYWQRATAGSADDGRVTQLFYDGLGQLIQKKQRGPDAWQNIITDTRYDGLGRVVAQSQARYGDNSTTFYQYVPPGANLFRATTTSYDALGRVYDVTTPDGRTTSNRYWHGSVGTVAAVYDANNHVTARESDMLGRLRYVYEYSGNNGSEGSHTITAQTSYTYDPLDQLTSVVDALGNTTTITYDTLGRKLSQADPDMGAWSYTYYPQGPLATQTDARGITTSFQYDNADRLTHQTYSNGNPASHVYYDQGSYGKGQRTGACVGTEGACTVSQSWTYDARGRRTISTNSAAGVSRTFSWLYDSGDRVEQTGYNSQETVWTRYDAAWRAKSLCQDASETQCYVKGAQYTALDQPDFWTLGNQLTQDWNYSDPMARLDRLTVSGSALDRGYGYDPVGNISLIRNHIPAQQQNINFTYDARDRLTRAWTSVYASAAPEGLPVVAMNDAPPALATDDHAPLARAFGGGSGIHASFVRPMLIGDIIEQQVRLARRLIGDVAGLDLETARAAGPNTTVSRAREQVPGTFYRGINLNGPTVTIDGNAWDASTAPNYSTNGSGQCNEWMTLTPSTDTNRATMLKCWVQHWAQSLIVSNVPNGTYDVYLYVVQDWNDPNPETFTVSVEGQTGSSWTPGGEGSWTKLGPFQRTIADGTINVTTGGMSNFAGIEIRSISGGATATPTPPATNTPTATNTPPPGATNTPTSPPTATPTAGAGGTTFYRAINLNGPALTIDGNAWQASTAPNYTTNGSAQCNEWLTLSPSTDANRATMLKCWVQHWAQSLVLSSVPNGTYDVSVYVMQDWDNPSPETFTVSVEGQTGGSWTPGAAGTWVKLGPYRRVISDGTINVTTGGMSNFAGVEVYSVGAGATATPTNTATSTPTRTNTPVPGATNTPTSMPTATPVPQPPPPSYDETYSYNVIGNLTGKAGVVYTYAAQSGACSTGALTKAHAATSVGGQSYCYDANGNLLSGGGRTMTWNAANQVTALVMGTATETYTYNTDGIRTIKVRAVTSQPTVTTVTFEGLWEEVVGGTQKRYYVFNGQTIAVREGVSVVTYLHGDHLGSLSVSTSSGGAVLNTQHFDPWGKVRSGSLPQTRRNFTGQELDDTGLLYYNARYYDPALARFISADTIAPNRSNPQSRNRYSYVLNNSLKYIDPSGHCAEGYDTTLQGCEQYLNDHGWTLNINDWSYDKLSLFVESVVDLKRAAGWSIDEYRSTMTGNGNYSPILQRASVSDDDINRTADVRVDGKSIVMRVFDVAFSGRFGGSGRSELDIKATFVHEQAHVWDFASGSARSKEIASSTGNTYRGSGKLPSDQGPTEYSDKNAVEDWAETVTTSVYRSQQEYVMGPVHTSIAHKYLPCAYGPPTAC